MTRSSDLNDWSRERLIAEVEKLRRTAAKKTIKTTAGPTITLHDGFWCVTLPGRKDLIPVGRKGSLKGELFSVLGERWGVMHSLDYVLEQLQKRVTDQRAPDPDMRQVENAMREINRSLYEGTGRRAQLTQKKPNQIGMRWKQMLWVATLIAHDDAGFVGFVVIENPPTGQKSK